MFHKFEGNRLTFGIEYCIIESVETYTVKTLIFKVRIEPP